jgi:hypothetical protein
MLKFRREREWMDSRRVAQTRRLRCRRGRDGRRGRIDDGAVVVVVVINGCECFAVIGSDEITSVAMGICRAAKRSGSDFVV